MIVEDLIEMIGAARRSQDIAGVLSEILRKSPPGSIEPEALDTLIVAWKAWQESAERLIRELKQ